MSISVSSIKSCGENRETDGYGAWGGWENGFNLPRAFLWPQGTWPAQMGHPQR